MRNDVVIARERKRVLREMLPDTCTIYPFLSTGATVNEYGILEQTSPDPRTYNGSTSIPCRFDLARAFRPDMLREQEVVTTEYNLELPYDFDCEESDIVVAEGAHFKIRRLKNKSNWDLTTEALIFHVTGNED